MSKKTKIRKVDFVSAMNALDGIKRIVESETARNMCVVWHSGNLAAMIKPFDMAANGSGFDKAIKQDDFNALVCKWFGLFDWLSSEDSHADLFFAFLQMNDEFIKAGSGCFSPGAFIGVYGVFRVALMRCLTSKGVRTFGGKSTSEAIADAKKEARKGISKAMSKVEFSIIHAKGEKTSDDYIVLQYEIIKRVVKERTAKGERRGVIPFAIRKAREESEKKGVDDGNGNVVKIPRDGGLKARDEHKGKYATIRHWLIRDGLWVV